jgi:hypothetical protein
MAVYEDCVIVRPSNKPGESSQPVKISYMIEGGKAVLGKEEVKVRQEWVAEELKKGNAQDFGDLDELRKANDIEAQGAYNQFKAAKVKQTKGEAAFHEAKTETESPGDMMSRNSAVDRSRGQKKLNEKFKLRKSEFYEKLATFLISDATGGKRINVRKSYTERHPNPVPVLAHDLRKAVNGECSLDSIGLYAADLIDSVKQVTGRDLTGALENLQKSHDKYDMDVTTEFWRDKYAGIADTVGATAAAPDAPSSIVMAPFGATRSRDWRLAARGTSCDVNVVPTSPACTRMESMVASSTWLARTISGRWRRSDFSSK